MSGLRGHMLHYTIPMMLSMICLLFVAQRSTMWHWILASCVLAEDLLGHTFSTAGTFGRNNPRNALRAFPAIPLESTVGIPQALYNSRHLRLPEHFQKNSLPLSTAGDVSSFRSGSGEGLSELAMEFSAVLRVCLSFGALPPISGYFHADTTRKDNLVSALPPPPFANPWVAERLPRTVRRVVKEGSGAH